jgi:NADH dehydrogenase
LICSLADGEHFGERALLEDRIWRFDAVASEPTELVSLPSQMFDWLKASRAFRESVEETRGRYSAR